MKTRELQEQQSAQNNGKIENLLLADAYQGATPRAITDQVIAPTESNSPQPQSLPQITIDATPSELAAQRALQLFPRLDTNGNDFLDRMELSIGLQDSSIKNEDALALATLYRYQERLAELHDDFGIDKSRGITKADLTQFKLSAGVDIKEFAKAKDALAFFHPAPPDNKTPDFAKFDLDRDAALSDEELRKASSARRSVGDAATLEYLMKERDENGALNRDETPYIDLAATEKLALQKAAAFSINSEIGELSRRLEKSVAATKLEATGTYSYPDQGQIGDCYLVAAIASIMRYEPALLKSMIRQNDNDTYTVTFPGDKDHPVTITPPTQAEQTVFLSGSPSGSIIEKALGEYRRQKEQSIDPIAATENFSELSDQQYSPGTSPIEILDGGWDIVETLRLLTGKPYGGAQLTAQPQANQPWQFSHEDFTQYLSQHLAASNAGSLNLTMLRTSPLSESSLHAYSLLDFDANGADGGTVTLRDPHGGFEDGIRKYSIKELSELEPHFFGPISTAP
mgnify:CR=1 FL=1